MQPPPNGLRYTPAGHRYLFGARARWWASVAKAWKQVSVRVWKMLTNHADSQPSAGRVREWRLGIVSLVSIPCHLEPDVRFSLIRLSDNLLLGVFKTSIVSAFSNLAHQVRPLHICLLALKYSLRWSSRDLSCGVIGLAACTVTYFLAEPG